MTFERIEINGNGNSFANWKAVSITAGVGQATRGFDMVTTEVGSNPFKVGETVVDWNFPPGVPVTITANGTLLLTGYVFVYQPSASPESHEVRISGRGKGADLIDSSVWHETGVFEDKKAGQIHKELATPFNVPTGVIGDDGAVIPYFQVRRGSTVHREMIRLIQERGLVMGEDATGTVHLRARDAQALTHDGGLAQGKNIIEMSARLSVEERYDWMAVYGQKADGSDKANDLQPFGMLTGNSQLFPRFRYKEIISPTATDKGRARTRVATDFFKMYGWETQAMITVPGFRDISGQVWEPGYMVFVNAPFLHIDGDMIIHSVEYRQDDRMGSITRLTLVDPSVYVDAAFVSNSGSVWIVGKGGGEGNTSDDWFDFADTSDKIAP